MKYITLTRKFRVPKLVVLQLGLIVTEYKTWPYISVMQMIVIQ